MFLKDDITSIKGIGDKTALLFSKASVFCVRDLLNYFPRQYIEYPSAGKIKDFAVGELGAVSATVTSNPVVLKNKTKTFLSFNISDGESIIKVYYFGMPYLKNQISQGMKKIFCGHISKSSGTGFLTNPKIFNYEEYEPLINRPVPIYPLVKGLTNTKVASAVKELFKTNLCIKDYIPSNILEQYDYVDINTALKYMHFPSDMEEVYKGRRRLALDEFLLFLYRMRLLEGEKIKDRTECIIDLNDEKSYKLKQFISSLPYSLTKGQSEAVKEIFSDIKSGYAMNRLLQGDVGSGKTIVAFIASYAAVLSGFQAAVMAPTVVLAKQHCEDILKLTEALNLDFKPALLTGNTKAKEKREILNKLKNHEINILIGTHALFTEDVEFDKLGITICDEQHRFGVKQRMSLLSKGENSHFLVMSATPIPRTLGLILYGDLDISVIKDKPAERLPIKNAVVGPEYREKNYQFIIDKVREGRQAYIICPMIEEGVTDNQKNVTDYYNDLIKIFPEDIQLDVLHGKMKPDQKNNVMENFKNHKTDVLISTTVVEVGVNVPNATVIMIENAERFGLSQLHQLRGRVGRGSEQSYAIFVTENKSDKTMERLTVLQKSNDGFEIASEDLKQRGPGDFFGLRQSGEAMFKMADIFTDADVLKDANEIIGNGNSFLNTLFKKTDDIAFFYFVDNGFLCL